MTNPSSQIPPEKPQKVTEKPQGTPDKPDNLEKPASFFQYVTSNTRDTIAYVILIIGIILLFFHPVYGGLLVGIISGLYFSEEIVSILNSLNDIIENEGIVRSLILGGLTLSLFIAAPAIFIGAAIAIGVKKILFPEWEKKS